MVHSSIFSSQFESAIRLCQSVDEQVGKRFAGCGLSVGGAAGNQLGRCQINYYYQDPRALQHAICKKPQRNAEASLYLFNVSRFPFHIASRQNPL
jgi:hypothetical protein